MRRLVTGKRAKEIDAYTMKEIGIPSMVLMERAALGVARAVKERFPAWNTGGVAQRRRPEGPAVVAVCGTGNNGADGVAAARMLRLAGFDACAAIIGDAGRGTEEFQKQLKIADRVGVPILGWQEIGNRPWDAVIDAVFGVGLSREIEGDYRLCLEAMNSLSPIPGLRVAVDIPSGIHADTGRVMGTAFRADLTVTFGWEKQGTLLYPGREYAGNVRVEDIGFPEEAMERAAGEEERKAAFTYGPEDLAGVPARRAYSNKGSFGRVLVVAGSKGMCGAAYLSALGAYRCGAGLVKILTVEENRPVLQNLLPEAILALYDPETINRDKEGFRTFMEEQTSWADVVVLGPGLGAGPCVEYLAETILTSAFVPVIIDADALNAVAAHPYLTSYYTENIIITPHLGEMSRLTGKSIKEIQADLPSAASEYAARYGITCVLKDAATVAAGRDGDLYINSSGCSAMAKAGSGDVLTGIIAGLIAIGTEEEQAAFLGVYIHGLAGERAGRDSHSMLASELADALRDVLPDGRKEQ